MDVRDAPRASTPGTSRQRQYLVIDLKSFYASVECVERGLDPMTTDLVVADASRTKKTICLAVSPSLKAKGVRNRCRLFEVPEGLDFI
ncbi:MAG: DNA repair protein, partial [Parafannyhessea umbonata]|nr:DNA repair protein [Parafannyhessea umbonata]